MLYIARLCGCSHDTLWVWSKIIRIIDHVAAVAARHGTRFGILAETALDKHRVIADRRFVHHIPPSKHVRSYLTRRMFSYPFIAGALNHHYIAMVNGDICQPLSCVDNAFRGCNGLDKLYFVERPGKCRFICEYRLP